MGGHWADHEKAHMNILELKAVLFGLKALLHDVRYKHIQVKSYHTTFIAILNNCGGVKLHLLNVTEEIFDWAYERKIGISAEYIKDFDYHS